MGLCLAASAMQSSFLTRKQAMDCSTRRFHQLNGETEIKRRSNQTQMFALEDFVGGIG